MKRKTIAPLVRAACQSNIEEGIATTPKTIDYARLGVVACEAFAEGPASLLDFIRTTLSIAAKVHAKQSAAHGNQPEPLELVRPIVPSATLTTKGCHVEQRPLFRSAFRTGTCVLWPT